LGTARRATERGLGLRPASVALLERNVVLLAAVADWRGALAALKTLGAADGSHPWW